MKLISALLTYISFFTVIIGAIIELYLLYKEAQYLNSELKKFYNLVNFNNHTYMFICDKDLNISFMNNKIKEDYNYKIDNNKFKNELLRVIASEENADEIMRELTNKNNWRGIVRNLKKDSIVDCSIQLINSEKDEQQVLVTYLDMSENIKLHSEIEAHRINDIKKSEFISTLSHELKTPLNIFYSIIQLLDKTESIGIREFKETYDKYSSSLKLNSKRMLRLVNNIVDSNTTNLNNLKNEFSQTLNKFNTDINKSLQNTDAIILELNTITTKLSNDICLINENISMILKQIDSLNKELNQISITPIDLNDL